MRLLWLLLAGLLGVAGAAQTITPGIHSGPITVAPDETMTILAQQPAPPSPADGYTLTVAKTGTGSGTVTGAGSYPAGTKVTPVATPDADSTFDGWAPAVPIIMDANRTATATFTRKPLPPAGGNLIDQLPAGQWLALPNTKLRSVAPVPLPPASSGFGGIMAWSGAAYDTKRDQVLLTGGGHGDYGGNEVYGLRLAEAVPAWRRLWGPSPNIGMPPPPPCPLAYPDGAPFSRHNYDGLEYLPTVDRFMEFGGLLFCQTAGSTRDVWWFDPDAPATPWERKADAPAAWPGYSGHLTAWDPVTKKLYANAQTGAHRLHSFDPATNTWAAIGGPPIYGTSAIIDPVRRRFVAWASPGRLVSQDLKTGGLTLLALKGDTEVLSQWTGGLEYDPVAGKYVLWAGGPVVYLVDPAALTVTRYPTTGAIPAAGLGSGVYGRFRYVPSKDVFVLVTGVNSDVLVYRPAWRAARAQALPPASPPAAPSGGLSPGVFLRLDPPSFGGPAAGSKHTTCAYRPDNRRIYCVGGDHQDRRPQEPNGRIIQAGDSYRLEVYSLDLEARLAPDATVDSGWRREWPYCGADDYGGISPKGTDFVGWAWDPTRKAFWMVPGTMVDGTGVCPSMTAGTNDDLKYRFRKIMTFSPDAPPAMRWREIADVRADRNFWGGEPWAGSYDPVKDRFLRFGAGLPNFPSTSAAALWVIDGATGARTARPVSRPGGGDLYAIRKTRTALDLATRSLYASDMFRRELYRLNLDTLDFQRVSVMPPTMPAWHDNHPFSDETFCAGAYWLWRNRIDKDPVKWPAQLWRYDPGNSRWSTPGWTTSPPDLTPAVSHAIVCHEGLGVLVFVGNVYGGARKGIWVYRPEEEASAQRPK